MKKPERSILITGGAGFIGNHVVRLFVNKYPDYLIVNLDKLTYAGNLANLKDIENRPNYRFVKADIADLDEMRRVFNEYGIDGVIHLAAESHVDRSIKDPFTFARTNVMGTLALLQAARERWESLPERYEGKLFYHISTDEVYGALELTHPEGVESPFTTAASSEHHHAYGTEFFLETTGYNPHSPYSASKLRATISFAPITTHTECRHSLQIARTITDLTSSPKNSFRFSSTISAKANHSPSTVKARTCATGSLSKTMHAPLT